MFNVDAAIQKKNMSSLYHEFYMIIFINLPSTGFNDLRQYSTMDLFVYWLQISFSGFIRHQKHKYTMLIRSFDMWVLM